MASLEQLYNDQRQEIFPKSIATGVQMASTNLATKTAEDCILDLYAKYDEVTGIQQQKNNITIETKYCRLTSKNKDDAINVLDSEWSDSFTLPDSLKPYTWKRTKFKFSETDATPVTIYEIIAADVSEKTQTIYYASYGAQQPEIKLPVTGDYDEDGNPILDENKINQDDFLPEGWSFIPISISAQAPNVYMVTRTKKDAKWGDYSPIAQFGKWAYDSVIVLKYAITGLNDPEPDLESASDNPGSDWMDSVSDLSSDFTGKIWQINATSVNGVLSLVNNKIWSGPNLISIVK